MMGANTLIDLISAQWSTTTGGKKPTIIALINYGQGNYRHFDQSDEAILVGRPSKDFTQPGVEQYYEQDSVNFSIIISTLTSITRYEQMEKEVRRIFLAYTGSDTYSRIHLNAMNELDHVFYFVAKGTATAWINLARVR